MWFWVLFLLPHLIRSSASESLEDFLAKTRYKRPNFIQSLREKIEKSQENDMVRLRMTRDERELCRMPTGVLKSTKNHQVPKPKKSVRFSDELPKTFSNQRHVILSENYVQNFHKQRGIDISRVYSEERSVTLTKPTGGALRRMNSFGIRKQKCPACPNFPPVIIDTRLKTTSTTTSSSGSRASSVTNTHIYSNSQINRNSQISQNNWNIALKDRHLKALRESFKAFDLSDKRTSTENHQKAGERGNRFVTDSSDSDSNDEYPKFEYDYRPASANKK